jgi:hypothetical protein
MIADTHYRQTLNSGKGVKHPMRDPSYHSSKQHQQMFSRGGEKKVMKKSLSLLLAIAMVFGMFASVVSAADSGLTTQQKYDELKAKGIFAGYPDGTAGLDKPMNRAQFARVAALILGLDGIGATDTKVVTEKPFSDVELDAWYVEEVAAAKEAGIMVGNPDGTFNPNGNITVQELAVVTAQSLGLEPVEGAEIEGAADWAAGYIQALLDAGINFPTNYTQAATRAQLVDVSYQVNELVNPDEPEKVSVVSAKATGVAKVEVTLDKAVDTSKATLTLKRGSATVETTTEFVSDKVAVLTLKNTKISDGEYTVTLAGLEADAIAQATASFVGEKEKVTAIEFVNANDTLARSANNIVKIRPTNQYGEVASASAGSYTVAAGRANDVFVKLTKDETTGELLLTLNTTIQDGGVDRYQAGTGIIPVNIYNNDSYVSASKNFKMGTEPFITKLEISPVRYSNGKDYLGGKGENAIIDVIQYDQYGNLVAYSAADDTNIRFVLNGYEPQLGTPVVGDSNGDNIADIKLSLVNNVDKSTEYTFTVFNQAGNASGKLSVRSAKTINKVELGDIGDVIAAGDSEAFIPVIGYDADGNQLSVDDLVNDQNNARLSFSVSGASYTFERTGKNKGKLKLTGISNAPKSVIAVTAVIAQANANSVATRTYTVSDARVPDRFVIDTNPKQKIVANASSEFKIHVYDQYGKKLENLRNLAANGNVTTDPANAAGVVSYAIEVTKTRVGSNIDITKNSASFTDTTYTGAGVATFNDGFKFEAGGTITDSDSATFTARILKRVGGKTNGFGGSEDPVEIAKITKKIEGTTEKLTYTVEAVPDLFNAIASGSVTDVVYGSGTLTEADQENPLVSQFRREIKLSAIDSAGNSVAVPDTIQQVTSSNPAVARTGVSANKGYVLGNAKGSASLNVTFLTSDGRQVLQTVTVNVKDDLITAASISAGNGTIAPTDADNGDNAFIAMNLKVKDNYGIEYEGLTAKKYNYLFGVTFSVANVDGGGTVNINQYGDITITGTVNSYELTATTANGYSVTSYVQP